MNTWMTIKVVGGKGTKKVTKDVEQFFKDFEAQISTTDKNSEVYILNEKSCNLSLSPSSSPSSSTQICSGDLSDGVFDLTSMALKMADETDGAFNPCLYPVTKAWGFTTDSYKVPDPQEISYLLEKTDYKKVEIGDENQIAFPSGMMFDFGGIGKGYAGDRLIEYLKNKNLRYGIIDLGGNIQTFGHKPNGSPWNIGIRNPVGEGIIAGVSIDEGAVITSGGYERFFTADDSNKYIHIIDPKTGMPVDNGLVSVTIVCESGAYGDALSTALFVMGKEKAIEFWKNNKGEEFQFIIMSQSQADGFEITYTAGLKENFSLLLDVDKINIVEK